MDVVNWTNDENDDKICARKIVQNITRTILIKRTGSIDLFLQTDPVFGTKNHLKRLILMTIDKSHEDVWLCKFSLQIAMIVPIIH